MDELAEYFSDDRLTCLICGHDFAGLFRHVERRHGMTASQYKNRFGIPLTWGLTGRTLKKHNREHGKMIPLWMEAAGVSQEEALALARNKWLPSNAYFSDRAPAMHEDRVRSGEIAASLETAIHRRRDLVLMQCSQCSNLIWRKEMVLITFRCRVLCRPCKKANHAGCKLRWQKSKRGETLYRETQLRWRAKKRVRDAGLPPAQTREWLFILNCSTIQEQQVLAERVNPLRTNQHQ